MDKINIGTGKKYIPHFIRRESDLEFGSIVTHEDYNARFNLNTIQGDHNTETLRLLLTISNIEDVPHVPYIDNYINEIIDELDTKTNDKDLATVAKSGSYTDLSNVPTKLSSFENDTNYVNTEELNNNLTNLSKELVTLLQDINKDIDTVEDMANTAINSAASAQNTAASAQNTAIAAQNTAVSAEEKANTANTNAEEALTLAQGYGEAIANKQDQLTAGTNIHIIDNVISATDTTYIAGDNVTIVDNVISSTDTKYSAGANIVIDENNVISSIGGGGGSGVSYIAGDNIVIEGNVISAIDTNTTYTAGDGINIEDDTISSKPWFFTFSKGPDDTFTLGDYPEIGAMFVKIANYYLKYKEMPIVYWYDNSLTNGKISFTNTNLHKLQALYFGTSTQLNFVFSTAQNSISSKTGTYGIKGSYINWTSTIMVTFRSSELDAGEIVTIPTGASCSGVKPIYVLQEDGLNKILATNNTTSFTPTSNYHPATKKYVDDTVANAKGTEYTAGENISISEDNVISAILKTYENIITEEDGTTTYIQSGDTGAFLRVANAAVDPTQRISIASNSILISDGDNVVALQAHHNYTNTLDSSYIREAQASNGGMFHYLAERLGEEGGPSYSLLDGMTGKSAQLTPADLTLSGVSVMNTLNEKVTNGNTTYPVKVYVQDTQPAAEEGYTVVWINTAA